MKRFWRSLNHRSGDSYKKMALKRESLSSRLTLQPEKGVCPLGLYDDILHIWNAAKCKYHLTPPCNSPGGLQNSQQRNWCSWAGISRNPAGNFLWGFGTVPAEHTVVGQRGAAPGSSWKFTLYSTQKMRNKRSDFLYSLYKVTGKNQHYITLLERFCVICVLKSCSMQNCCLHGIPLIPIMFSELTTFVT